MTTTASRLFTPEEAAGVLRISPSTVRRLVRQGFLPAARVGGQWRLHTDDVERVLAAGPQPTERTTA